LEEHDVKALVTGGAGFIGSTLVDALLAGGHSAAVLDNFSTGSPRNLEAAHGVVVHEADVRDPAVASIVASDGPDVLLHLAAQLDVRVSVADPIFDADVNVLGTLRLLEAARASAVSKVVVASSGGCVYGDHAELPIKETYVGTPESPYGISKRVLHDYLEFYRHTYGLESVVLALSNVCGPRQDPYGEAGVVAMFLGAMLEDKPTTIFGDGSQTRDFVYVGDVVDAFVRAMDRGAGVYNIGTGTETSVLELWRVCAKVTGYGREPIFAPARAGELQRNCLDWSKAHAELGWSPRTSLEDAVAATAEHIAKK
jgi:UDP-glucose 4-epimerase